MPGRASVSKRFPNPALYCSGALRPSIWRPSVSGTLTLFMTWSFRKLSDQEIQALRRQANTCVVIPSAGNFGENVFIAGRPAVAVDINVASADVKPSHHFRHVGRNDQCVSLARGLHEIRALFRNPIVLEVVPSSLK